jgi:hypothetical protein
MSNPLFGSPEALMRRAALTNLTTVWDFCKPEIMKLNELLDAKTNGTAREYRDQSFSALKQIIMSINEEYVTNENPDVFETLVKRLNDSFKKLYLAYIVSKEVSCDKDNIETLTEVFFNEIQRKLSQDRLCNYAGVTKLVKFVRNHEEHQHRNKPVDLITGKSSFGNLFTLTSILILSFYAQIEILSFWLKTEGP